MKRLLFLFLSLLFACAEAQPTRVVPVVTGPSVYQASIVSAYDQVPLSVAYNTAFGSIPFQSSGYVLTSTGGTESLAITWDNTGYDETAPGEYTIFGDYSSLGHLTNPFLVRPTTIVTVQPQSFTENFTTSGSWLCPNGVTEVYVQCWAEGGTGASSGTISKLAGGGGGAYAEATVSVTAGNTYNYVVSATTLAPLPSGADVVGINGDNTTWNSTDVVAEGGKGGGLVNPGEGGQAVNSTGTIKYSGGKGSPNTAASRSSSGGGGAGSNQDGQQGIVVSGTSVTGGVGGSVGGGAGGNGSSGAGITGNDWGGAGSGARNTAGGNNTRGGPSGPGHITITYSGATTPPPDPGDAYVVWEIGQSNILSPGNGSPGAPYTGAQDSKIWINSSTGFQSLEYGVNNNPGGSLTGLGPEISLMYTIAPDAPGETYLTKKGQSGTSMYTNWNVANNSTGRTAVTQLIATLDYLDGQGKDIKQIIAVFRQGEADMGSGNPNGPTGANVKAEYKDKYQDLIKYTIDQVTAAGYTLSSSDTKLYWIDVNIDNTFGGAIDVTFQTDVVSAKSETISGFPTDFPSYASKFTAGYVVSTVGRTTIDGIHFNTASEVQIGLDCAALITIP